MKNANLPAAHFLGWRHREIRYPAAHWPASQIYYESQPHNDPAFEARKQAFAQALMDAIKAIRRAHGLPEDLKDWTPAQLAEREVSRQILMKYVFGEVCNAPPLDQQPSPLPTPFAPTVHT